MVASHTHRSALDYRPEIIPTGLNHPAQGCEERATLGQPFPTIFNPERVASPFAAIAATRSGLWPFGFITRRSHSFVAATPG